MTYHLLKGSQCYIETTRGAAKTITGGTNASPPVFASTAHGFSNDDPVLMLIESWEDFYNAIFEVTNVDTDDFEVAGYPTTDTDRFPAGGAGTAYKITAWQKIGQILDVQQEGGEPKFEEAMPYDQWRDVRLLAGETGVAVRIELGFDPLRTDQGVLLTASRARATRAFKFVLAGGAGRIYGYGPVWASENATFQPILRRRMAIAFLGMQTSFT